MVHAFIYKESCGPLVNRSLPTLSNLSVNKGVCLWEFAFGPPYHGFRGMVDRGCVSKMSILTHCKMVHHRTVEVSRHAGGDRPCLARRHAIPCKIVPKYFGNQFNEVWIPTNQPEGFTIPIPPWERGELWAQGPYMFSHGWIGVTPLSALGGLGLSLFRPLKGKVIGLGRSLI